LENQRTDVATSVWLMTIFFEKTYGDLWREGISKIQIHFQRNNLGTGGERCLTNGFITKPAESTVNKNEKYYKRGLTVAAQSKHGKYIGRK
jgi:hypothetical protein